MDREQRKWGVRGGGRGDFEVICSGFCRVWMVGIWNIKGKEEVGGHLY